MWQPLFKHDPIVRVLDEMFILCCKLNAESLFKGEIHSPVVWDHLLMLVGKRTMKFDTT